MTYFRVHSIDGNHLLSKISFVGGLLLFGLFIATYVVPSIQDRYGLNQFPGPKLGKVSNFWMLIQARKHTMSISVHKQHEKHGDFVRLSPNHLSINRPDSVRDIMGHGNGFRKSDFYYAFDNIEQGIFTTRDRSKHARKRRFVSHMFSPRSITDFEPFASNALRVMCRQLESLLDTGSAGEYVAVDHLNPKVSERKKQGEVAIDAVTWALFLAFDIIGDLAFGKTFGFCEAGRDTEEGGRKLRDRGEWCSTVGQMPWIKTWTPYFFFDSFFTRGMKAAQGLAVIGIASVERRKATVVDPNRKDILHYLLAAKDPDTGGPLPDLELKAEALTQLIAGSDTTGNSIAQVIDILPRHPEKMNKLLEELDATFPAPLQPAFVAQFAETKDLPYLQAVLLEVLRLRTVTSMGLPRVVGEGGANVCGHRFKEGTVLSVPTYTVHRDERIWGQNALEFEPERWLGDNHAELDKHFLAFSYGPRACIGRNVAFMELKKAVATLFRRFHIRHVYPERLPHIREGFHNKCDESLIFISRRT